ncbi:MAG: HD domain-containing phosphohydrolase [Clostridia bacterium]
MSFVLCSMFYVLNDIEKNNITKQVKLYSNDTCKSTALSIGNWVKGVNDSIEIMASSISAQDLINFNVLKKKASILSKSNQDIKAIIFSRPSGEAISFGTKVKSIVSQPYFVDIMSRKVKSVFGQPSYSSDFGKTPQIILARAIVDKSGKAIGVLSATILLDTVYQRVVDTKIGGGGVAWMIDATERIIVPPDKKIRLFSSVNSMDYNGALDFLLFIDSLDIQTAGEASYKKTDGQEVYSTFQTIPNTFGWKLIITTVNSEILAPLKTFQFFILLIGGIVFIFSILMSILISRKITAQLFSLVKEVKHISTHTRKNVHVKGASFELKQLEDSINTMADEIHEYTNLLEEKVALRTKELKDSQQKLEYLSFHDPLTGLSNRTLFDAVIKKYDAEEYLPLSIIMGDVNNLKLANDIFGHREGDNLLIEVANVITNSIRENDIAVRWGGDEFIILMPHATGIDAETVCKKIKAKCKKVTQHMMPISISLGYCEKNEMALSISDAIKEADKMLYTAKMSEGKIAKTKIVQALREKLSNTSIETFEHQERVEKMSVLLGKRLALSKTDLDDVRSLASLHSIGKIGIPSRLLSKEGKLTAEEIGILNTHSEIGYRIAQATPEISRISALILAHNEWWDGTGYPLKLKGNSIPMLSRMVTIIDAFDTMTHHKLYGHVLSNKEALEEIQKMAGKQFDPRLVKEFVALIESKI